MGFGGNTGTSTISGATDASTSNILNNDVLTYNTSIAKWQNKPSALATDATSTTNGVVRLAGDLGGTATAPTVPGLATKATDASVVHNTGNETIAGVKNFTGTIQSSGSGIVITSDSRLSDQRTPTDGSVTAAKLAATGATVGQVLSYTGSALGWSTPTGLTTTAVKTAAYTAVVGNYIPVDATAGTVTVTLPTAPADGSRVSVKLIATSGAFVCTILRGGSTDVFNVANGAVSLTLSAIGIGVTLTYAATSGIWYSQDSTPLSSLVGSYAPLTGPVPSVYAASNDTRFVSATASRYIANFTLAVSDAGAVIEAESASAITVTVPPTLSVPFIDNTLIEICQTGSGQITLAPGAGVTLQNAAGLKSRAQWSSVSLRKRPGSGATLPTANMLMRFKGDDITGSNGAAVSSWPESSGNSLPAATQGTTANQPTLAKSAMNGHSGVTFNGTSQFLSLTGSALNITANLSAFSLFVVYTCPTVSSGSRSLVSISNGTSSSNIRVVLQHRSSTGNNLSGGRRLDADSGVYITGGAVVANENVLLSAVYNYGAATQTLYKNGTSAGSATFASTGLTSNTPSLAASIGSNALGTSENFYGTIMEIIAYSSVDATARASIDTYVQNTYGITVADYAGVGDQWVVSGDTTT